MAKALLITMAGGSLIGAAITTNAPVGFGLLFCGSLLALRGLIELLGERP